MADLRRRQVLAATSFGLGLVSAGCSSTSDNVNDPEYSRRPEKRTVTVYLELSQDGQTQLQEINQELRQQLQRGDITREEAENEFSELQSQLNTELTETAWQEAQSLDITVKDSKSMNRNPPVLLVSGQSEALLEYTELDIVEGISSADQFSEFTKEDQTQ